MQTLSNELCIHCQMNYVYIVKLIQVHIFRFQTSFVEKRQIWAHFPQYGVVDVLIGANIQKYLTAGLVFFFHYPCHLTTIENNTTDRCLVFLFHCPRLTTIGNNNTDTCLVFLFHCPHLTTIENNTTDTCLVFFFHCPCLTTIENNTIDTHLVFFYLLCAVTIPRR